jgi:hypothetical protein
MATGPGSFRTPNSPSSIPIFYDSVYYGYIPTNPPPDFTLPKPPSEMSSQEIHRRSSPSATEKHSRKKKRISCVASIFRETYTTGE